jgi:hypothetical protein
MSPSRPPRDTDTKCRHCGECRPEAMAKRGLSRGLCYEHTLIQGGREPLEDHHPLGRDNDIAERIVVHEVPGNWHRALDARRALRDEVLKRPGDNPIHQIAAAVATLGEAVDAFSDFARRQGWPEWTAELADIFASTADSATEWLLKLAGKLDEWRPGWIGEMPKWRP